LKREKWEEQTTLKEELEEQVQDDSLLEKVSQDK